MKARNSRDYLEQSTGSQPLMQPAVRRCGDGQALAAGQQDRRATEHRLLIVDPLECQTDEIGKCRNPGAPCRIQTPQGLFFGHCIQGFATGSCYCGVLPDLTIAKTHNGDFFQNQTGAQYTITVSNVGDGATSETVTMSEAVPDGLTATAIVGTNWTCTQPAGPCTRSDRLAAGASYDSITLTVDVDASAPSTVTNSTTVSGGSEHNTANNTASDPTTICTTLTPVVNNNNDSGVGSLRYVLANACQGSTITFAPNVTGAIALTSGELSIVKNLTITGPGANILTVQRSAAPGTPAFRIFNIAPASVNAAISGLTISNGDAMGSTGGGGIYNTGALAVSNTTISGNNGTGGSFGGGGIFNSGGTMVITNSTISGNIVGNNYSGGGIANTGGTVTITNTSISGNSATYGGGIYNFITGTVNITNSTISSNTVSGSSVGGGGVHNVNGGTVRARNTIIALNSSTSGPDVNGALTSQNFNLIGNNSGATITPAQPADQIGTASSPINPLLGDLQDNGGPTFTRALRSGSTAIDRGHSSGSATDQRGFTRPVNLPEIENDPNGDGGDIGAFEIQPPCTYVLQVNSQSFAATGGTGAVGITAPNGCSWMVVNNNPEFISITSGSTGTGSGTVDYSVAPNPSNSERRTGTLSIGGQNFTVLQGPQFLDVPVDALFYTEIGKLAARAVTLGCGSGNFCPDDVVTREQMAAFIVRARGEFSPPMPASQRFEDVPPSNIFYDFIDRLAELQITLGCTPDHLMYCPADPVKREQMAAFLLRGLGEFSPPAPMSQRFLDVPPENVFYDFIDRMAVRGITQGCNPDHTLYCPGDNVTRAQMAAFLVRAFDL